MADTTEDQRPHAMRLRRRPALQDISNQQPEQRSSKPQKQERTKRQRSTSTTRATGKVRVREDAEPAATTATAASRPSRAAGKRAVTEEPRSEEQAAKRVRRAPAESSVRPRPEPVRPRPDPVRAEDVLQDMFAHFYHAQNLFPVREYMSQQRDVNARMRAILVDWLIEVHYKFKLAHQTLFLCVHIIDRFLQVTQVARAKLQLVGVTALLIACKYEEIYPPELRDCVYITDAAYTKEEILDMERNILQDLDFQLTVPTAYHFLTRYLELLNAPPLMRNIAGYYADRNLQEHSMLQHTPAQYAAAAVYAAMRYMKQHDAAFRHEHRFNSNWPLLLQQDSHLTEDDLIPVAREMMAHMTEEVVTASRRRLVAAKRKYQLEKYLSVSELPLPDI